ncbi:MAG: cyclic nucleotide-binding domain-containing protein [Treponema sp.]|jgi:CRP-like cAMP-binding protein|nr:cyclic nucleotide-binding domain-containing protein [Treponema sp.]
MVKPAVLERYPLFGGLTGSQLEQIIPLMEAEGFEAGALIISEGSLNDRIRFILEGRIAVIKQGTVLAEMAQGDEFGEMEVLDIMPSEAAIRALSPVRVLSISNKALYRLHHEDPDAFSMLIMNLARDLSRRLRRMDQRVARESPIHEWG